LLFMTANRNTFDQFHKFNMSLTNTYLNEIETLKRLASGDGE